MNLELTPDQELFRQTTRRFIETEAPITEVRALADSELGFDRGWWTAAAELGWTALLGAEDAGGGSLSGRRGADAVIVAEEMGRMVTPGPFLAISVVTAALSVQPDQHPEVLASLVSGSGVATWALAEPGGRWDAGGISTTAEAGADGIVVDGVKAYVEAAPAAHHFLVTARTGAALTQVLVPADSFGVTVRPARSLDLTRRFGEVQFDHVRLPHSAVVGGIGEAAHDVERQLELAVALQCAETVGALDRVFEFTRDYMGERYAFGRPIASYQALKHRVADILLWLESAKATTDGLVRAWDDGAGHADRLASVAKVYVAEKSLAMIQECMQFHGGISVTWEHDIHLYLRRATVNRAVWGTPEQHRERLCTLLGV